MTENKNTDDNKNNNNVLNRHIMITYESNYQDNNEKRDNTSDNKDINHLPDNNVDKQ